ncbi:MULTISPECIES: diaminopropionate ammonia-lyase [unclassified Geodermatophilus]
MSHRLLLNEPARLGWPAPPPRPPAGDGPPGPREFHRLLPGYRPTELRDLPSLAERLGVGSVVAKVETLRMGLPAYKILGASWATYRAVLAARAEPVSAWSDLDGLKSQLGDLAGTRLVAATDGNHGRAVARMARLLGWEAHVLVPAGTAQARIEGITGEGAGVEVVDGSYEDAVTRSATYADERTLVVSDTAWEGYRDVPGWVVDGYATVFAEVDDQVAEAGLAPPTHAVVPVGVGSLAAAAAHHHGPRGTTLVSVEPTSAACVMASVAAGTSVEVPGPHTSSMAGLNCGLPSPLALPVVRDTFRGLVAIDDAWAEEAMRVLAGLDLAVGESAAAALGGLLCLRPEESAALGLDASASVLLVLTEGVTDPVNYARVLAGSRAAER